MQVGPVVTFCSPFAAMFVFLPFGKKFDILLVVSCGHTRGNSPLQAVQF